MRIPLLKPKNSELVPADFAPRRAQATTPVVAGLGIRVPTFLRQVASIQNASTLSLVDSWPNLGTSRQAVLSIPTAKTCRDLIVGAAVQMAVRKYRGTELVDSGSLLSQPDPDTTWSATLAGTIEDLLYDGRAYWLVLATDGVATQRNPQGLPVRARWIPTSDVEVELERGRAGAPSAYSRLAGYRISGVDDLVSPELVIRFDSPLPAILDVGADAIAKALALEDAAARLSDVTIPAGTLTNTGEAVNETEAEEIVARFEEQRATHGVAFLQDVEYARESLTAEDLQLVAARANSATEIARLHNMPVAMASASPSGGAAAMLYANLGTTLALMTSSAVAPYLEAVAQTLSLDTVTAQGQRVAFDTAPFLRSDPNDLREHVLALLAAQVISTDEARAMLGLNSPTAGGPTP